MAVQQTSLERVMGFSQADLDANRAGRLSGGQKARLLGLAVLLAVFGLPLSVGCLLIVALADYLPRVMAVAGVGGGFYLIWQSFALLTDALAGGVGVVTANLSGTSVSGRGGTYYYAVVGSLRKGISGKAYADLPRGLFCWAYCAPASRILLTVEPATAAPASPAPAFRDPPGRVWNRVRWGLLFALIGLVATASGAAEINSAHPAEPVLITGVVSDYEVRHGKNSSTYYLYLENSTDSYRLDAYPAEFQPPLPLDRLIHKTVGLYVNRGTSDVIAVRTATDLHTADLYRHPENQRSWQILTGVILIAIGILSAAPWPLAAARRRGRAEPRPALQPASPRPPLMALLASPPVTAFVQAASLLTGEQRQRILAARVLGQAPGPEEVQSIEDYDEAKDLLDRKVTEATLMASGRPALRARTESALLGLMYAPQLRPRELVAAYGPYLEAVPLHTLGVGGTVAEVWRSQSQQELVRRFQEALTASPPRLPDTPERIEAAICLSALQASTDQDRRTLAENLVDLAALGPDAATAEAEALVWLGLAGEIAATGAPLPAGTLERAAREHRRRHRVNLTILVIGAVILVAGTVFSAFGSVVGLGGAGWLWFALVVAASLSVAAGFVVVDLIRYRAGPETRAGTSAVWLPLAAALLVPAAVLALGTYRINDPLSVGLVVILVPLLAVGSAVEAPRLLHRA